MSSKYQIWLTHNGESEKIRFPVLPDVVKVGNGSLNKSVNISGLGEIVIKQDRPALVISFDCFFPVSPFPGVQFTELANPKTLKEQITSWKNSDKPVHFIITGTEINMHCTIEDFPCSERGGDVGAVYYSLTLKEYREVSARQVRVDIPTKTATLAAQTPTRTDNRVAQRTYTVVRGDCLWSIAAKHLGNGARYPEIKALNPDKIKNSNLIYAGWVLKLPS